MNVISIQDSVTEFLKARKSWAIKTIETTCLLIMDIIYREI